MDGVINVDQIVAVAREHSDNQHIVRRDDLTLGLVRVRPHDELPVHTHAAEHQLDNDMEGEGFVRLDEEEFALRPGIVVTIPPGVAHGGRNPFDMPLRYLDMLIVWKK
jgi:mannose-6-phosphate isomerase-like protein (cupin superfamily)